MKKSVDLLVTDSGADQEALNALHGAGLNIDVVELAETCSTQGGRT